MMMKGLTDLTCVWSEYHQRLHRAPDWLKVVSPYDQAQSFSPLDTKMDKLYNYYQISHELNYYIVIINNTDQDQLI